MAAEFRRNPVERMIDLLELTPHPEGGFFRETYRSASQLGPGPDGMHRCASTAIYFLLPADAFSSFHLIRGADEVWHHYSGDPVEIHQIAPHGDYRVAVLGSRLDDGERPQIVVPAGTIQAALVRGTSFALCGCTVSPGFDFADFAMPTRDDLLARFPQHAKAIERLTR